MASSFLALTPLAGCQYDHRMKSKIKSSHLGERDDQVDFNGRESKTQNGIM